MALPHPSLANGAGVDTPAFVYSVGGLRERVSEVRRIADSAGCRLLYSIKACETGGVLGALASYLDGFAASSPFEARLARGVVEGDGEVHLFSPAVAPNEVEEVAALCDYVSLNSLGQLRRYSHLLRGGVRCGLRVNPGLSHVDDERYDPGRPQSKLGVGIDDLPAGGAPLPGVSGLHVHDNCDSHDLTQLLETVLRLDARLGRLLDVMEWINLGGGYLFGEIDDLQPLYEAAGLLKMRYGLDVYVEPGAALVRDAGCLVSTVLDLFDTGGKQIAVLDTTVNHMPEVFEYQFKPDVAGDVGTGGHRYVLAGRSCLAGDVFGEYGFDEPLEPGSRVVFTSAGAYTLVKAHTFNGIDLPAVYMMEEDGKLTLERRNTGEGLPARVGARAGATV